MPVFWVELEHQPKSHISSSQENYMIICNIAKYRSTAQQIVDILDFVRY